MHVVAVLALDGVVAFDLTIPCQVFASARRPDTTPAYEIRVCAERTVTATACEQEAFRISSRYSLDDARDADTVIVPDVDPDQAPRPRTVRLIRDAAARSARVACNLHRGIGARSGRSARRPQGDHPLANRQLG